MQLKRTSKIVIDLLMTVALMALMGYQFWGDVAHEWIGAGMFVLFIAHHVLNLHWYKTMFKGRYTPYRTVQRVIDILVFAAMIGLMISGIMLSSHVFAFLPISGGKVFARKLHLLATHWGFVLMSLHLGLHWNALLGMVRKVTKTAKPSPIRATLLNIAGIAIAVYGLYAFIDRDFLSNMLLENEFVFLDYDESKTLFYLDYLAMMGFFAWVAHNSTKLLGKIASDRKKAQRARGTAPAVGTKNPMKWAVLIVPVVTIGALLLLLLQENAPEPGSVVSAPEASQTAHQEAAVFAFISGGPFYMGSLDSEAGRGDDEILHPVVVSDFYMGVHEITQAEYQEIMGDNPSTFSGENLPVENVTWFDAIAYCNARSEREGLTPAYTIEGQNVTWNREANGYRLPTEAEWEYACRAGTITPFNTQTAISEEEANYYRETAIPVGSFSPNAWGLYDMHGNVSEWVWDYYGEYDTSPQIDPTGPASGSLRVNRGGGWNDLARHLRSAYRSATPANDSSSNLGFRVVLGATEVGS